MPDVAEPKAVVQKPSKPATADGPYADDGGIAYLKAAGWSHLGPPMSPACLWIDPTKELVGRYEKVPVMIDRVVRDEQTGGKTVRIVREQAQAQTGVPGSKRPAFQTVWYPPGEPMPIAQALQEQIARDQRAQRATIAAAQTPSKN